MYKITHENLINDQRGLAALMVIIIIGAAVLLMAFTSSWMGFVDLDNGFVAEEGEQVAAIADGCLDNALQRLRYDVNYTGESLNYNGGSCIINVTSAGSNRTTTILASMGNYYQSIRAAVSLSGNVITLLSWEEI